MRASWCNRILCATHLRLESIVSIVEGLKAVLTLLSRIVLILALLLWAGTQDVSAEWYVGGYGGYSVPSKLKDVTMNPLGQIIAEQQFPQALDPLDSNGRGTLTQTFKTSDISLKNSPIYGIKGGYFFSEEKLPWLGVEIEAFGSTPTIKSQTVNFVQDVTYQPNTPALAAQCAQPAPPPNCPAYVLNRGTLSIQQQSDLRVIAAVFNVVVRYPGKVFQPYLGAGGGGFFFWSPHGSIQGHQWAPGLNLTVGMKFLVTEEWGFFAESKYNQATFDNLDPPIGLSAQYNAVNFVAGLAYHF
jgi:hypothetical protein